MLADKHVGLVEPVEHHGRNKHHHHIHRPRQYARRQQVVESAAKQAFDRRHGGRAEEKQHGVCRHDAHNGCEPREHTAVDESVDCRLAHHSSPNFC
ncbi:MAG: hypothetical protein L6U61_04475 [Bacteroidales bacterium]|nr:MAG: hypothetical protein L6U61_04475 [Bacteroidales bacterium]